MILMNLPMDFILSGTPSASAIGKQNVLSFPNNLTFNMKITQLLFVFSLMIVGFSSCAPVDNGGGTTVDATQKFIGRWNVNDQPARLNYVVEIKNRPGYDDQVILENFADLGTQAIGLVVSNTIVIDNQSLGGPYRTEGTGTFIKSDQLEFEFMLDDSIDLDARKASFTK